MPIQVGTTTRRMADDQYRACVYEALRHVFAVHNELGRLFDEKIYQRELAFRIPDARREVAIDVTFEEFNKRYFLDLLVAGGAIFELKTVEALTQRHRRQLLHYLFLTDLPHGKLVNLRPERVEHEFVNNTVSVAERTCFVVDADGWEEMGPGCLRDRFVALLRDWGTGLDTGLYEEAGAFLSGQAGGDEAEVDIHLGPRSLGRQRIRLAGPQVGLRITALPVERHGEFVTHLSRFLEHTDLRAVQWINVTRSVVGFRTVRGKRR